MIRRRPRQASNRQYSMLNRIRLQCIQPQPPPAAQGGRSPCMQRNAANASSVNQLVEEFPRGREEEFFFRGLIRGIEWKSLMNKVLFGILFKDATWQTFSSFELFYSNDFRIKNDRLNRNQVSVPNTAVPGVRFVARVCCVAGGRAASSANAQRARHLAPLRMVAAS